MKTLRTKGSNKKYEKISKSNRLWVSSLYLTTVTKKLKFNNVFSYLDSLKVKVLKKKIHSGKYYLLTIKMLLISKNKILYENNFFDKGHRKKISDIKQIMHIIKHKYKLINMK